VIERIEARVEGSRFSTFAITESGERPDEIQNAQIVAAMESPKRHMTFWLLRDGRRYIRLVTRGKNTSGAYIVGGEELRAEYVARAALMRLPIRWGAS